MCIVPLYSIPHFVFCLYLFFPLMYNADNPIYKESAVLILFEQLL